ncbi:MAG: DNA gyrase inhibitor YacG [Hyphomicrobiaceae bacterium]
MASKSPADQRSAGRCPICGEPRDAHYRPFCSKRCADIDLAHWVTGKYVIAGGNADADEDGDDVFANPNLPKSPGGTTDEDA